MHAHIILTSPAIVPVSRPALLLYQSPDQPCYCTSLQTSPAIVPVSRPAMLLYQSPDQPCYCTSLQTSPAIIVPVSRPALLLYQSPDQPCYCTCLQTSPAIAPVSRPFLLSIVRYFHIPKQQVTTHLHLSKVTNLLNKKVT